MVIPIVRTSQQIDQSNRRLIWERKMKSTSHGSHWPTFYQRLAGRQPRPLLTRALTFFERDPTPHNSRQAIDIGCGDGTETLLLIEEGWHVLSIDAEPEALRLVESRVPTEKHGQLQMQIASFEKASFVAADLIYAGFSLPFCGRQYFTSVWHNLTASIRPGGRFAGHLFGEYDTWATDPEVVCLPDQEFRSLFDQFEIEYLDESESDEPTAFGDLKHWHIYEVIAKKRQ
jgi:tellurite methyltransferase